MALNITTLSDAESFKLFTSNLEELLKKYEKVPPRELLAHQRKQLKALIATENNLRKAICNHKYGNVVYANFVHWICKEKKNILAARPFFRERQTVFTKYISPALKKGRFKTLKKFRVNWLFFQFVMNSKNWENASKVNELFEEVKKKRTEIFEQNLPLAISQAKKFWNSVPKTKTHLTYMDIIQLQGQGLLLAIDKFTPQSDKGLSLRRSLAIYRVFRAVAIGIMSRERLTQYSETLMHFYPKEKHKLYIANKYIKHYSEDAIDHKEMASKVNKYFKKNKTGYYTNPDELASLLANRDNVGVDEKYQNHCTDESDLGNSIENRDLVSKMTSVIKFMSLKEQKMFRMKGIFLGETNDR